MNPCVHLEMIGARERLVARETEEGTLFGVRTWMFLQFGKAVEVLFADRTYKFFAWMFHPKIKKIKTFSKRMKIYLTWSTRLCLFDPEKLHWTQLKTSPSNDLKMFTWCVIRLSKAQFQGKRAIWNLSTNYLCLLRYSESVHEMWQRSHSR